MTTNLTSLEVIDWIPENVFSPPAIKWLLLRNRSLRYLSLRSSKPRSVVNWDTQAGERLPALEVLVLEGCTWDIDRADAVMFWDVSHTMRR